MLRGHPCYKSRKQNFTHKINILTENKIMDLKELKTRTPNELLAFAEELGLDNIPTNRKQDMMFAILKELAASDMTINGGGVLEILQDGFGFLRSAEENYLLVLMIFMYPPIKSNDLD